RIDPSIRCAMHIGGIGIALALVALADLQHELAVLRKFQKLIVGNRLEPWKIIAWAVVAANPDEALVVNVDPASALDPLVARAGGAPRSEIVAGSVEHHDGGCRHRGLFRLQRARPMQQEHLILGIDRKARNITDSELRRHFWPSGFDLEAWQGACLRTHIGDREYRAKDARCQNRMNKAWAHEFLPFVMVVMLR